MSVLIQFDVFEGNRDVEFSSHIKNIISSHIKYIKTIKIFNCFYSHVGAVIRLREGN